MVKQLKKFLTFITCSFILSALTFAEDYRWISAGVEWPSPSAFCPQSVSIWPSNYSYAGLVAGSTNGGLFFCGVYDSNRPGQIFTLTGIGRVGDGCPEGLTFIAETGQCIDKRSRCDSPSAGNPITILKGKKTQFEVDYSGEIGGLSFNRRYSPTRVWSASLQKMQTVGKWHFDFASKRFGGASEYVTNQALAERSYFYEFIRSNGESLTFTGDQTNGFVADSDQPVSLTVVTDAQLIDHWKLTLADDSIENYSMLDGSLESIHYKDGREISLTYASGSTTITEENSGDIITLNYTGNLVTSMLDPDLNEYVYSYDANDQLESVRYPDNNSDPLDNPLRQYHYEDTNSTLLTGITDERGIRFATWNYDDQGRATLSKHESPTASDGVDQVSFDYTHSRESVSPHVIVTNKLGQQTKYFYKEINGVRKIAQVERLGHNNADDSTISCAAANQYTTYDANGYKDLVVDWKGNAIDYDYNSSGLEVSRIEGLVANTSVTPITTTSPIEARTITTLWHPNFRLPTRVVEPDRIVDTAYDCDTGRMTGRVVYDAPAAPTYNTPSCPGV